MALDTCFVFEELNCSYITSPYFQVIYSAHHYTSNIRDANTTNVHIKLTVKKMRYVCILNNNLNEVK